MSLSFLSPVAMLVALACVVPLLSLANVRSKGHRTRRAVGLPRSPRSTYVVPVVALLAAAVLVGLAAGQPVVEFEESSRVRTDAEALIVIDITRSMLAKEEFGAASRIARAKAAALALRRAIPAVPVGLASLTDRTLPHLFPSADPESFRGTLARSFGIERPPPAGTFPSVATRLESLSAVVTQGFYSPTVRTRALVVLTDGESLPPEKAQVGALFRQPPAIRTIFVHVWKRDERVFVGRLTEPGYQPDPAARETLDQFAALVGGTVFSERQAPAAGRRLREILASGPTVVRGERKEYVALAPFLAASAFLPLLLLLWRRDR